MDKYHIFPHGHRLAVALVTAVVAGMVGMRWVVEEEEEDEKEEEREEVW